MPLFAVGGKKVSAAVEDGDVQYTIGVVVYNQNSPEMNMFMNYYREYIQQGFPVKFYFSGSINSAEDEINFIRAMKLQGVSGIISFYGQDIQKIVEACDEEEMYYIGFEEYLSKKGVCIIEWASLIPNILPKERLEIELSYAGDSGRNMKITAYGVRYEELAKELML